ncbi:MAG: hypothetical protein WAV56_01280 [Microgenomates group bacterium]
MFIVLYGPNNLGKSKQFDLLEILWQEVGRPYARIKYPIYDSPTGQLINRVLRPTPGDEIVSMAEVELQAVFAQNRRWFEPTLRQLLLRGDVLAEDYVGTGLAWGMTGGVSREELDVFNSGLLRPDIEILLDGSRFSNGVEKRHRNEGAGQEVWERNRRIHQELAREFGWVIVNANGEPEEIHTRIRDVILPRLG